MLFVWLAIVKYDFLKIIPIANRLIGDHISDGFLLLDETLHVVEFNNAFQVIFEKYAAIQPENDIYDFAEKLKANTKVDLLEILRQVSMTECTIVDLVLESESGRQYFQLEITPVYKLESYLGLVLLFIDITWLKRSIQQVETNQKLLIDQKRRVFIGNLKDGIIHNLKSPLMSLAGGLESLKGLHDEYRELIREGCMTAEDHLEISREMTLWIERMKPYCSTISDIVSAVKGHITPTTEKTSFSLDHIFNRLKLLIRYEMKKKNIKLDLVYPDRELILYGSVDDLIQVLNGVIMNLIKEYDETGGRVGISVAIQEKQVVFIIRGFRDAPDFSGQKLSEMEPHMIKAFDNIDFSLNMIKKIIENSFNGQIHQNFRDREGSVCEISIPQGS